MNRFYDNPSARLNLNSFIAKLGSDNSGSVYLGNLEVQQCMVHPYSQPESLRLVQGPEGSAEEVVVVVAGILCNKTLPPVVRELKVNGPKHITKLQQFIKLSGLGSPQFNDLLQVIHNVHKVFCTSFPKYHIKPSEASTHKADYAVNFHSQYFTAHRTAPDAKHVPFRKDVDPYDILENLRGANFIHASDNNVQYCQKVFIDGQGSGYKSMDPRVLKEGDIIEASISFVVYRLKPDHYKMVNCLSTYHCPPSRVLPQY